MPDGVEVRIRGMDELAAATKELARNVGPASAREFGRVADAVAADVAGSVPKRTGRLASSVTARRLGDGASVSMGDGVRYAEYVEYGGRGHRQSAQGNYLYPAAMDAEPALLAAGARAADDAIGATHWPHPT